MDIDQRMGFFLKRLHRPAEGLWRSLTISILGRCRGLHEHLSFLPVFLLSENYSCRAEYFKHTVRLIGNTCRQSYAIWRMQ